VTDNPENPHPETLVEEAALAVIDHLTLGQALFT